MTTARKTVAAKLAFMVIDAKHPDDSQDDKEYMAARLLHGAIEHELKEQG